jgi:hypothetical protein
MELLIIAIFLHVLLTHHGHLSSSCLFKYFGTSRAHESDINKFGHCKEEKRLLPSPSFDCSKKKRKGPTGRRAAAISFNYKTYIYILLVREAVVSFPLIK